MLLACQEGQKIPALELEPEQYRRVISLVRRMCVNYDAGKCILLDHGEGASCPQTITGALYCHYFKAAVLGADPVLYAQLYQGKTKRCIDCGQRFIPAGNRAVRCAACALRRKRKKAAERKRKQRDTMSRFRE